MSCPVLRFLSFYLSQLLAQKERLEGQVKDAYVEREKLVQEGFDSLAAMESEIQALRYFTYEYVSVARKRAGFRYVRIRFSCKETCRCAGVRVGKQPYRANAIQFDVD